MVQLRAYEKALNALGHEAEYRSGEDPDLAGYDEAWLFNINFKWTLSQARAAKRAGVPYRVFAIYYPLAVYQENGFSEMREIAGEAKKVYALSLPEKLEIREELYEGYEPSNLEIIDNGVNKDLFNKDRPDVERIGVISVGRICPQKGTLRLIEACASLDLPLTLIGQAQDSGYMEACMGAAQKSRTVVEFKGPMDQAAVAAQLALARLFVLSSLDDRNSLSLLEAAASGCMVLDSKYNRASIEHGFPIADPKNEDSFKMEIKRAYKHPRDFSANVKSWEEIVADILKS